MNFKDAIPVSSVHEEYEYLKLHFPGYKLTGHSLVQDSDGKHYDRQTISIDGEEKEFLFYIESFFHTEMDEDPREEFLNALAQAYKTYRVGKLEDMLADDFSYASMWVSAPDLGPKYKYVEYLNGKLLTMRRTRSKCYFLLVHDAVNHTPLLVIKQQGNNGQPACFVVQMNTAGKAKHLDLTALQFYQLSEMTAKKVKEFLSDEYVYYKRFSSVYRHKNDKLEIYKPEHGGFCEVMITYSDFVIPQEYRITESDARKETAEKQREFINAHPRLFGNTTVTIETLTGKSIEYKTRVAFIWQASDIGLAGIEHLDENAGMLYANHLSPYADHSEGRQNTRGTPIPVDMLFINYEGRIIDIAENMPAYDTVGVEYSVGTEIILEINAGQVAKHGIKVGDHVKTPVLIQESELCITEQTSKQKNDYQIQEEFLSAFAKMYKEHDTDLIYDYLADNFTYDSMLRPDTFDEGKDGYIQFLQGVKLKSDKEWITFMMYEQGTGKPVLLMGTSYGDDIGAFSVETDEQGKICHLDIKHPRQHRLAYLNKDDFDEFINDTHSVFFD